MSLQSVFTTIKNQASALVGRRVLKYQRWLQLDDGTPPDLLTRVTQPNQPPPDRVPLTKLLGESIQEENQSGLPPCPVQPSPKEAGENGEPRDQALIHEKHPSGAHLLDLQKSGHGAHDVQEYIGTLSKLREELSSGHPKNMCALHPDRLRMFFEALLSYIRSQSSNVEPLNYLDILCKLGRLIRHDGFDGFLGKDRNVFQKIILALLRRLREDDFVDFSLMNCVSTFQSLAMLAQNRCLVALDSGDKLEIHRVVIALSYQLNENRFTNLPPRECFLFLSKLTQLIQYGCMGDLSEEKKLFLCERIAVWLRTMEDLDQRDSYRALQCVEILDHHNYLSDLSVEFKIPLRQKVINWALRLQCTSSYEHFNSLRNLGKLSTRGYLEGASAEDKQSLRQKIVHWVNCLRSVDSFECHLVLVHLGNLSDQGCLDGLSLSTKILFQQRIANLMSQISYTSNETSLKMLVILGRLAYHGCLDDPPAVANQLIREMIGKWIYHLNCHESATCIHVLQALKELSCRGYLGGLHVEQKNILRMRVEEWLALLGEDHIKEHPEKLLCILEGLAHYDWLMAISTWKNTLIQDMVVHCLDQLQNSSSIRHSDVLRSVGVLVHHGHLDSLPSANRDVLQKESINCLRHLREQNFQKLEVLDHFNIIWSLGLLAHHGHLNDLSFESRDAIQASVFFALAHFKKQGLNKFSMVNNSNTLWALGLLAHHGFFNDLSLESRDVIRTIVFLVLTHFQKRDLNALGTTDGFHILWALGILVHHNCLSNVPLESRNVIRTGISLVLIHLQERCFDELSTADNFNALWALGILTHRGCLDGVSFEFRWSVQKVVIALLYFIYFPVLKNFDTPYYLCALIGTGHLAHRGYLWGLSDSDRGLLQEVIIAMLRHFQKQDPHTINYSEILIHLDSLSHCGCLDYLSPPNERSLQEAIFIFISHLRNLGFGGEEYRSLWKLDCLSGLDDGETDEARGSFRHTSGSPSYSRWDHSQSENSDDDPNTRACMPPSSRDDGSSLKPVDGSPVPCYLRASSTRIEEVCLGNVDSQPAFKSARSPLEKKAQVDERHTHE